MANALQTLASEVMRETGYNPPSTFIGNNAQDARRMVAIVNTAGREIARILWHRQIRIFSVSISGDQFYALPAGFYQFVSNTGWNGTDPLIGPPNVQEWQFYTHSVAATGINYRFRVFTHVSTSGVPVQKLQVDPTTSASPVTFHLAYQLNTWAVNVSASTTFRTTWTSEDDDPTVDQELLRLCVKWRWLKAKGLDWKTEYTDYRRALGIEKARDGGGTRKLSMDGRTTMDLPHIPETGVGL